MLSYFLITIKGFLHELSGCWSRYLLCVMTMCSKPQKTMLYLSVQLHNCTQKIHIFCKLYELIFKMQMTVIFQFYFELVVLCLSYVD